VSHEDSSGTPSRRAFLASAGMGAAALAAAPLLGDRVASTLHAASSLGAARAAAKTVPIGIELYAVRRELTKDLPGTLRAVAEMGYKVVEFYSPYQQWTFPYAKEVRTRLDDLGLRCYSTHNNSTALLPGDGMAKAIELNQVLGSRHIIMASPPPRTATLEDWTRVAAQMATASETLRPHGLLAGFHNHQTEWKPFANGKRAMDVLAEGTPADFVLQLDVGTVLEAGVDPVAWIKAHPGRIRSVHVKDWAPGTEAQDKGYRVLFAEGSAPWKQIFEAVESVGGVEFYLMEQEGSRYSELETAKRCLETWKKMRGEA
jgi:sugar phosphate isomerase/epimerase